MFLFIFLSIYMFVILFISAYISLKLHENVIVNPFTTNKNGLNPISVVVFFAFEYFLVMYFVSRYYDH